jgi:hypothetical protein
VAREDSAYFLLVDKKDFMKLWPVPHNSAGGNPGDIEFVRWVVGKNPSS